MNRRRFLYLLVVALSGAGCARRTASSSGSVNNDDLFDGFRGVPWDTPVEEMEGQLKLAGMDPGKNVEWYVKKNENLSFGDATLESIQYVFYGGLFIRVAIVARGIDNFRRLREYLSHKLGENLTPSGDAFTWKPGRTTVMLAYNRVRAISLLIIQKGPGA